MEDNKTAPAPKPAAAPVPPLRPGPGIQIEIGEAEGQGTYANLALITHSAAEVVLDFARVLPGLQKAKVYSRIVMTPYHAKALLRALGDNLGKYEATHGAIKSPGPEEQTKSIGF